MASIWLNKFKDPNFRLEVYEYLIERVQQRIDYLVNADNGLHHVIGHQPVNVYQPGYTGHMCLNLVTNYNQIPGFIRPTGRGTEDPSELNMLLPELERPRNLHMEAVAWWGDDLAR